LSINCGTSSGSWEAPEDGYAGEENTPAAARVQLAHDAITSQIETFREELDHYEKLRDGRITAQVTRAIWGVALTRRAGGFELSSVV
jgi:hypothetical protein